MSSQARADAPEAVNEIAEIAGGGLINILNEMQLITNRNEDNFQNHRILT